jgi:hypothetical protein
MIFGILCSTKEIGAVAAEVEMLVEMGKSPAALGATQLRSIGRIRMAEAFAMCAAA